MIIYDSPYVPKSFRFNLTYILLLFERKIDICQPHYTPQKGDRQFLVTISKPFQQAFGKKCSPQSACSDSHGRSESHHYLNIGDLTILQKNRWTNKITKNYLEDTKCAGQQLCTSSPTDMYLSLHCHRHWLCIEKNLQASMLSVIPVRVLWSELAFTDCIDRYNNTSFYRDKLFQEI